MSVHGWSRRTWVPSDEALIRRRTHTAENSPADRPKSLWNWGPVQTIIERTMGRDSDAGQERDGSVFTGITWKQMAWKQMA